jgi:hypothetical protein
MPNMYGEGSDCAGSNLTQGMSTWSGYRKLAVSHTTPLPCPRSDRARHLKGLVEAR